MVIAPPTSNVGPPIFMFVDLWKPHEYEFVISSINLSEFTLIYYETNLAIS